MSVQQHTRSIDLALRAGDDLKSLFDKMGNGDAPRGRLLRAYRQARRALTGNIDTRSGVAVEESLLELRRSAMAAMSELMTAAQGLGISQAERQLAIYNAPVIAPATLPAQLDAAGAAWVARLDAQLASARALALTGSDEALVLGDEERAGVLTPGPIIAEGARWIAELTGGAFIGLVDESVKVSGQDFLKQAIAAIDERTTDCCLRVNGQVQPLNKPFKLTGEPRFADDVDDPPFHWWCRTAEALVLASDVDDALTTEMRAAGRNEIRARQRTGERVEIHPASARSGRA